MYACMQIWAVGGEEDDLKDRVRLQESIGLWEKTSMFQKLIVNERTLPPLIFSKESPLPSGSHEITGQMKDIIEGGRGALPYLLY